MAEAKTAFVLNLGCVILYDLTILEQLFVRVIWTPNRDLRGRSGRKMCHHWHNLGLHQ